jgi:preprotein translocase SecF subunit
MFQLFGKRMNILGRRRLFYTIALGVTVVCCALVLFRGVNLGTDYSGGSVVVLTDTGELTQTEVRDAFAAAGTENPIVQTTWINKERQAGFVVQLTTSDTEATKAIATQVREALELDADQVSVQSLGSGWRQSSLVPSLITMGAALVMILLYIEIRLGFKAVAGAMVALLFSLVVTASMYIGIGFAVTPTAITLLFTTVAYSGYTTMIFLQRINQDTLNLTNQTFLTVANDAVNKLLSRTVATTLAIVIPMIIILFTMAPGLREFCLVLLLGVLIAPIATIGLAAPLYSSLRLREPKYTKLLERYSDELA